MKTTAMDEDKKIILEGVFQKVDRVNRGRIYPVESLVKAAERYERTIAGGADTLIEHYEKYYEKTFSHGLQLNTAVYFLEQAIKLRMIKINKDHCTCIN